MSILKLYAPFFDGNNWLHVLTSGKDWMIILTLILMECLLSVDNAVVLAAQTQVLPNKVEQRKSLVYGLWGAYLFRFIVIGIGTYLINFWEIKLAGSIYLFYLAFKFFYDQRHPKQAAEHEKEKEEREAAHHKGKKSRKTSADPLKQLFKGVCVQLIDIVAQPGNIGAGILLIKLLIGKGCKLSGSYFAQIIFDSALHPCKG